MALAVNENAEEREGDSSEDHEERHLSHRRKFYLVRERLIVRYRRDVHESALEIYSSENEFGSVNGVPTKPT